VKVTTLNCKIKRLGIATDLHDHGLVHSDPDLVSRQST
jgi:hypothetical protein